MKRVCMWIAALLPALALAMPVAFVDVNVVPMDRERVLAHQTVVVDAGVIQTLGPAAKVRIPAGALRVRASGKYLMPGLYDMHVHLANTTELPLYLVNGVTTVLNLSGTPAHLAWRRRVAEGALLGPRIFSTGPAMMQPRSATDAVAEVKRVAAAGYDGVKVYSQVSQAEFPALVAQAKESGLLLVGHVPWEVGLDRTLQAGQAIAHAEELLYSAFNPGPKGASIAGVRMDEARVDAVARQVASARVYLMPTLIAFHDVERQAVELPAFLQDPHLAYLPQWIRASLQPGVNRYDNRYSPLELQVLRDGVPFLRKLTGALQAAGVPLLAGTDGTVIGPVAGFSLHEELRELVAAGLTPYQALRSATANPAAFLREGERAGAVAPGRRADLVLLDADPLRDVANAARIRGVLTGGRWLERRRLDALLAAVPGEHLRLRDALAAQLQADPAAGARALAEADPQGLMGGQVMAAVLNKEGEDGFERLIDALRAHDPAADYASEDAYNNLGYALLAENRMEAALYVLRKNARNFPRSANAADSLADGLTRRGDIAGARTEYTRALELDPRYINADGARKFLKENPGP
ncbi:MAG TPA: amidohydrolase family protein [Telluria sp.]|nr:amidohydrolase family protein [Telluria sp.]